MSRFDRAEKLGVGIGCLAFAVPLLIWLAIWGGLIYAAVHFIRKFW
jgi:hypothetical protein